MGYALVLEGENLHTRHILGGYYIDMVIAFKLFVLENGNANLSPIGALYIQLYNKLFKLNLF